MRFVIELTDSEAAIWAQMPEEDREVVEAGLGAAIRWWGRMHPVDERIARAVRIASEPPPPPEPDDVRQSATVTPSVTGRGPEQAAE